VAIERGGLANEPRAEHVNTGIDEPGGIFRHGIFSVGDKFLDYNMTVMLWIKEWTCVICG
jgi:hypothetical protein